jgi:hypothetical protein
MRNKLSKSIFFSFVSLGILFYSGTVMIYAEPGQGMSTSGLRRVNFSLWGGYAHSESRGIMIDVKAEIQFSLSSNIKAGFGIGYLSDSDNMHMGGAIGGMSGGMMGGHMGGHTGSFYGDGHDFRVIPLTLSLYYILPVSHKLDIFMVGGGGYYLSSFRDISTQENNSIGTYAGFGFDLEIADRIEIIAEGIYRFVNLKGFTNELHPGFREGTEGGGQEEGFWHYNHSQGEYHFHESHEDQAQMMIDSPSYNISLNGFSLRAGIKFKF